MERPIEPGDVYRGWTVLHVESRRRIHVRCHCGAESVEAARVVLRGKIQCRTCLERESLDTVQPGQVYEDWTVLERLDARRVRARCRCGRTRAVSALRLLLGESRRCGSCPSFRHGLSGTKIYRAWYHLVRTTTLDPSLDEFIEVVGSPPSPGHVLTSTTPQPSLQSYRWIPRAEVWRHRRNPSSRSPQARESSDRGSGGLRSIDRALWAMARSRGVVSLGDFADLVPNGDLDERRKRARRCLERLQAASWVETVGPDRYRAVSDPPDEPPRGEDLGETEP